MQLYSLAGRHEAVGGWPNALGGESEVHQRSRAADGVPFAVAAHFARVGGASGERAYRVRFGQLKGGASDSYVGLALDPDLGVRPEDDLLGVDTTTGLIWVSDPDSSALGYVLAELPKGARATVRQFSSLGEVERSEPITDVEAYAELSAGESAITERVDDVRFVISVGPVHLATTDVDLGFSVLRAGSLAELKERAAQLAGVLVSAPNSSDGESTGITEFRFTQAAPEPAVPPGVARVSLSIVPSLASREPPLLTPAESADLRSAVKSHGITALAFGVPDGETARVKIRVFDSAGRLVRTLTHDTYDPGAYRVQWDLRDERNRKVAPGVYIAIMEAPGFRDMTKLVVVR